MIFTFCVHKQALVAVAALSFILDFYYLWFSMEAKPFNSSVFLLFILLLLALQYFWREKEVQFMI